MEITALCTHDTSDSGLEYRVIHIKNILRTYYDPVICDNGFINERNPNKFNMMKTYREKQLLETLRMIENRIHDSKNIVPLKKSSDVKDTSDDFFNLLKFIS
jgi:hypothetical protein